MTKVRDPLSLLKILGPMNSILEELLVRSGRRDLSLRILAVRSEGKML
jgi:hypothetical protein